MTAKDAWMACAAHVGGLPLDEQRGVGEFAPGGVFDGANIESRA